MVFGWREKGMTLVEVLIALSIFVLVMSAIFLFEVNVFSYNTGISNTLETVGDAAVILKTMTRELRGIRQGANGAYPLVVAATSTVSFFVDTASDGAVEQVTYYASSTTLYRGVIQPTGSPPVYSPASQVNAPLVTNVRNSSSTPVFEYFDTNYNGTSSPMSLPVNITAVRLIKVNLTMDVDPKRNPSPVTYSAQINLRNLKSNL